MKKLRRNRKIICFFLLFPLVFSLLAVFPCHADGLSVSAKSAILIDADSGKILFEKNAHERLPMASTTKIMTAVVALENYPLSDTVSVDAKAVGVEGSSVYLHDGELLTMENLLYALLLSSANDAAAAIAIEVAGSTEAFALMMNEKAEELGLCDTHFMNPHGLDDENHYTTASDLAAIAAYALKNADFARIVSTYKKTIPLDGSGTRVLINHNKLLRCYDGAIGVKTGFTKRSGRCLVSAAERNGLRLVAVTLNAPSDWADHSAMLDFGFSSYNRLSACGKGEYQTAIPVIGGVEDTVLCFNTEAITATLPASINECDCVFTVEAPRFLYAPVECGETVGKLVCRADGEIIGTSELVAAYSVDRVIYKRSLWQKIAVFFAGLFS
ncbi:MAG: D-alanyl-D-alanine carboxypeptidase family protein [Eubacteriales bacterium]